tara:strand:- start:691 stop:912 length:222 start_codon:yes stop_codon:yes gene_type:complete
MKISQRFTLSFVAPFMIFLSVIGLILRDNSKKIFYLPIGLMGISIILEKGFRRKFNRKNILKKIKAYQKAKKI